MKNRLVIKVCSYRASQRYVVIRTILSALSVIQAEWPDLIIDIVEIREVQEILKITPVLIFPSLVVNEQLVCTGRFPKKEEVAAWLQVGALRIIYDSVFTNPATE